MNKLILISIIFLFSFSGNSQNQEIDQSKIKEDLNQIITYLEHVYVYKEEKKVDIKCIREYYTNEIKHIKTEEENVLFFEYLLNEFYDNHLTLGTNRNSSYRLFAPIYAKVESGKPIVANVWKTQIEKINHDIIGAEITKFNGVDFEKFIKDFPTQCNDKNIQEVKEWITNKILAGRYNQPRVLTLKLLNGNKIELDLDKINLKKTNTLISTKKINEIGIVRINNSLGNDNLVKEFDSILNDLSKTKGLIIDLRNTVFGGDTYEARGIMSRFIKEAKPYQKHSYIEKPRGNSNPGIERSWIEYVSPRLEQYKNPVVILVGRWTGSMGEGLAIGFEGMERAEIVGTEMRRLAGEVFDVNFKHQRYGYKLTTRKLHHINGTPREKYVPTNYVKQTTIRKDETLEKGIELINKMTE
jgi:C-terminal processing protease CtpA/Prc